MEDNLWRYGRQPFIMEHDLWWNPSSDGRQDDFWWKRTFDGRWLWWKMTFDGRHPIIQKDLWWKTTYDRRWTLMEYVIWRMTTLLSVGVRPPFFQTPKKSMTCKIFVCKFAFPKSIKSKFISVYAKVSTSELFILKCFMCSGLTGSCGDRMMCVDQLLL